MGYRAEDDQLFSSRLRVLTVEPDALFEDQH